MTQKSRKIRAIAAGGAVLGVGAAITLAAWSDSEFSQGFFNTQAFGIEAATDGITFTDHGTPETSLVLTANDAANPVTMVPGETLAYPYQIRNIDNGADSTVTYASEAITQATAGQFTTTAYTDVPAAACSVLDFTAGAELPLNGTFNLVDQVQEDLCITVTHVANDENPTTAQAMNVVWEFSAAQTGDQAQP